jgi:hypothetical protein
MKISHVLLQHYHNLKLYVLCMQTRLVSLLTTQALILLASLTHIGCVGELSSRWALKIIAARAGAVVLGVLVDIMRRRSFLLVQQSQPSTSQSKPHCQDDTSTTSTSSSSKEKAS